MTDICNKCEKYINKQYKLCPKCGQKFKNNNKNDEIKKEIFELYCQLIIKLKDPFDLNKNNEVFNPIYWLTPNYQNDKSHILYMHEFFNKLKKIVGDNFIFINFMNQSLPYPINLSNYESDYKNIIEKKIMYLSEVLNYNCKSRLFGKTFIVLFKDEVEEMFPLLRYYPNWTNSIKKYYYDTNNIAKMVLDFPEELIDLKIHYKFIENLGGVLTGTDPEDIIKSLYIK